MEDKIIKALTAALQRIKEEPDLVTAYMQTAQHNERRSGKW